MKHHWKQVSQKFVHINPWYSVRQDQVLTPEGKPGVYNVIVKPPAVFIVAVDEKRRVALIRLYRYPTQRYSTEIPAGGMEQGETPLATAKRELMEETGLTAKKWKKLGVIQVANGAMDQLGHVFLATQLVQEQATGRAEEGIENISFIPWKKVLSDISDGTITDTQSVSSLMLAGIANGWLK